MLMDVFHFCVNNNNRGILKIAIKFFIFNFYVNEF